MYSASVPAPVHTWETHNWHTSMAANWPVANYDIENAAETIQQQFDTVIIERHLKRTYL